MDIYLESVDHFYNEITNDNGVVLDRRPFEVDVHYKIVIGKHELDGKYTTDPEEYKKLSSEEVIQRIKNDLIKEFKKNK